jgi:hypothetical protein
MTFYEALTNNPLGESIDHDHVFALVSKTSERPTDEEIQKALITSPALQYFIDNVSEADCSQI